MPFTATISSGSQIQVTGAVANPAGTPGTPGQSVTVKGQWTTSTVYTNRDLAYNNGVTYACKQNHTAASGTEPGVGASWETVWANYAASPINDSAASTGSTYSSAKINTELGGKADSSHNHNAADLTSGTVPDARVAASNVSQHVGEIDHDQLLNYSAAQHRTINDAAAGATDLWSASKINTQINTKSSIGHVHSAADLTSGSIPDARVPETNVTQHEAAISITKSQISDLDETVHGSKSMTIPEPTDSDDITMFFTSLAITITEIRSVVRGPGTPSLGWTLRHSTDRSAVGNEVVTSGITTTNTTTGLSTTTFNDATIPANSFVWFESSSVSADLEEAAITVEYTED